MDQTLKDYLAQNKVKYVEHLHEAVHTVAESSTNKNVKNIPGLHGKTLFLKDEGGTFYLVGVAAEKRLDIKKLEQELKVKKLKFASADELKKETGLIPGSVSIFGAIYNKNVMLVLTQEIWNAQKVGFHPNINTATLELTHENLEKYYLSLVNEKKILEV